MTKAAQISTAFLVVVNAVMLTLIGFGVLHWTDAQKGLVTVDANAGAVLVLALYFHLAAGTKKQPVAIAGSVVTLANALIATFVGFHLWGLTTARGSLLGSVVSATVALIAITFARAGVTAPTSSELGS